MPGLLVPPALREKLGDAASEGLNMMFADAYSLAEERFERRLAAEIGTFRLEMTRQLGDLRFDLLKWSFLFWIGQLAALVAILR